MAKYTGEMVIRSRMLFLLLDVLESEIIEFEDCCKREGYAIVHEQKHAFNKLKHNIRFMCNMTSHLNNKEQMAIGDCSDRMRALMWRIFCNCYNDIERYIQTYNTFKAMFKPILDIDLTEDEKMLFRDLEYYTQEKESKKNLQ